MQPATKMLAGATAAALAAAALARHRSRADLTGQVALITGGSRGLGLLIGRELADRGCRLVICARNREELAAAERDLTARGAEVFAVPCDLADRGQLDRLVPEAVGRYGRLDILVNNAGIIKVGPLPAMSPEDFTEAVEIMLLAPIHLTLAALPHLRAAPAGRIVNITSIGGKVAAPHLLPYCAAKFGAVGFSQGLHAELAGQGVSVTTVVPGLMRTGSHLRAEFKGQAGKEYTWFAAGASAPLVAMDAERAARKIVNAAVAGRAELTLTPLAAVAVRVAGVAPGTVTRLAGVARRLLPQAAGGTTVAQSGQDVVAGSRRSRARSALTVLGRRAAERFQPAASARE